MPSGMEVNRLKEVYREYAGRGWGQSKWSPANPGNQAMHREQHRRLGELLERNGLLPLGNRRLLDVGCGTGEILAGFADWGAKAENLYGIDLLPERIQSAKHRYPQMTFQEANAEALPFANDTFDLISVFTVFTSILDRQMAMNISREIHRTLCPGGAVVWYDFRMNNPWNPHVRGVSRKEIGRLFPGYDLCLETITLLPPLARRLGFLAERLYPCLSVIPILRSHYLGVLRKPYAFDSLLQAKPR